MSSDLNSKRKHKTLTLASKAEILKRLDQRETIRQLAKVYNVGRSTIHDIRQNRLKIENFVKRADISSGLGKRKTLKCGAHRKVDETLYAWFLRERRKHTPITGEILREKAKYFYQQVGSGINGFKASNGWLDRFKKRHGISLLNLSRKKGSSSDADAAENLSLFTTSDLSGIKCEFDEGDLEQQSSETTNDRTVEANNYDPLLIALGHESVPTDDMKLNQTNERLDFDANGHDDNDGSETTIEMMSYEEQRMQIEKRRFELEEESFRNREARENELHALKKLKLQREIELINLQIKMQTDNNALKETFTRIP